MMEPVLSRHDQAILECDQFQALLDVLGVASLDGNVTFDFGFTPSAGETFTFLTADALNLSGVFSSDTFNARFSRPNSR